MDCFFHHAVPSIARCTACGKPLCATCRGEGASCATCRLAERIDGVRRGDRLPGGVAPSGGTCAGWGEPDRERRPQPRVRARPAALAEVRPETRALVALAYPFWPLALIALLDRSGSLFVRRQAWQALGFNLGIYALGAFFSAAAALPLIGISAWPLVFLTIPVAIVASIVYGFLVWNGEDVDVPIISDWVDARLDSRGAAR